MPGRRRVVVRDESECGRLPEWAAGGVVLVEWLVRAGLWQEATDRLRLQREGGYAGIDALLMLILFFSSGLSVGLKEFCDRTRECQDRLAAIGGRRRLPTQSSMSRILAAVEPELLEDVGGWVLGLPGLGPVLKHPSVLTRDARGDSWHVFDWDPTVETVRHRALPVLEGTPEARRRSESLTKPGYPGRKRGDAQFSRAMLQHAGSGLWLGIEMGPGNGGLRDAFQRAITQIVATCRRFDLALERIIVRADGVAGNVPFITACRAENLHYITRLAHYQLLEDPRIVEHLNRADWFDVPSSGAGPARQAADLGQVTLEPSPNTRRKDGSAYDPVEVRVVVSRFRSAENGRGAGVVLDGCQYELWATSLDPGSWPAADIVAGYFGRCGQENRFAQEDRELGLGRIFSYHLPGQQLASLVGLLVWNFQICRGLELAAPPTQQPEQPPADRAPSVTPMPPLPIVDSAPDPEIAETEIDLAAAVGSEALAAGGEKPTDEPHDSVLPPGSTRHAINKALDTADWQTALRTDGWAWAAHKGGLLCPAKAVLPLVRIGEVKGEAIEGQFLAHPHVCDDCPLRRNCFRSDDPHYRKDVRLLIPTPQADAIHALWESLPRAEKGSLRQSERKPKQRSTGRTSRSWRRERSGPHPIHRRKPLAWLPPSPPTDPPPLALHPPALLAAVLRKLTRETTNAVAVKVALQLPAPTPKRHPALATGPADRQKRRLTWAQRLSWNQLEEEAQVDIELYAGRALDGVLKPPPGRSEAA